MGRRNYPDARSIRRRGFIWSLAVLVFSAVLVTLVGYFGVEPFARISRYYVVLLIPTIILLLISYFIIDRIFSGPEKK